MNRPEVEHFYESRPSWREHGKGTAFIRFRLNAQGGIDIKASEHSSDLRGGGKEVYIEIPREKVDELMKMIVSDRVMEVVEQVE